MKGIQVDWQANPEAAQRFTRNYETAWKLIKGEILVHDADITGPPGWLARRKLKRALTLFDRALEIHATSWQSLWGKGKIYQRLGDVTRAYESFVAAHRLAPEEPDVAREAALAALETGDSAAAIELTEAAIAGSPDDAGLISNLALAYLLDGQPQEALRHADRALQQDPGDTITVTLHVVIKEVVAGDRPCPNTLAELNASL